MESVPSGADAYVMKHILHDWDDARASTILKNCRAAIPDHGKLLVLEMVMTLDNEPHPSKWLDVHMMVVVGGKERTKSDFRELLGSAGFELTRIVPLPRSPIALIEAAPA